jgi:iron complex transport system substrate-binding protein
MDVTNRDSDDMETLQPMNIISLLPSTTEIVYALGLGEQLRAVTHECDFPEDAKKKPHLTKSVLPEGEYGSAEIDRLVRERVLNGQGIYELDHDLLAEIEPDLILTQELCDVCAVSYDDVLAAVERLPKTPRVASFEPDSLELIFQSIYDISWLASHPERGRDLVASLQARLDSLSERLEGTQPKRVLCLEWLDPPMVGGHWVPEMVRLAGGADILGPENEPSVYVSWDEITAAEPDVVILMPCGYDLPTTVRLAGELDDVPDWRELAAVRAGEVYAVDGSGYFNRPGPRVVDGIELLARLFHPDRCSDLGPDAAEPLLRWSSGG